MQTPPAYSAVKVGGKRAYALARAGETPELAAREIEVREFSQLWREGDRAAFRIVCGSGTYVRSLIADLNDAYCVELRRTRIGPFRVGDADPERLIGLADALSFMPRAELDEEDARRAAHGVAVAAPANVSAEALLVDAAGPIAIAERRDQMLHPVVGFRG